MLSVEAVAIPAAAAVTAFVFAWYLLTFVGKQVTPALPPVSWVKAGAASAVLAVPLALLIGSPELAWFAGPIAALLVAPAWVDVLVKRLPNLFVAQAACIALVLAGYVLVAMNSIAGLAPLVGAAAGISAVLLLVLVALSLVSRGGMGMGDAKYAPVLAFFLLVLTAASWPTASLVSPLAWIVLVLVAMFWLSTSFVIAGVAVLIRLIQKRKGALPFGPFLATGWVIAFIAVAVFDFGLLLPT